MSKNQVYTTGDVATLCNVQKTTVIHWVERGEIPAHQLPGRGDRRIQHADLVAFMKRNGFPLPVELQEAETDVLVVEDEANVAKAIQRALVHAGLRVEIAGDGFRAGSLMTALRPAVVTLDLMMPGMNGLEVLQFIRQQECLQETKVLVVSALPKDKMDEALAAGADAILSKPFSNAELVSKVSALLESRAPKTP